MTLARHVCYKTLGVRATIDAQDKNGDIALHLTCKDEDSMAEDDSTAILELLLQFGANPFLTNGEGDAPLDWLRQDLDNLRQQIPEDEDSWHGAAIALLEQAPEAQKASLLIKARRLVVPANSNVVVPVGWRKVGPCRTW